jgi:hypothetical protein
MSVEQLGGHLRALPGNQQIAVEHAGPTITYDRQLGALATYIDAPQEVWSTTMRDRYGMRPRAIARSRVHLSASSEPIADDEAFVLGSYEQKDQEVVLHIDRAIAHLDENKDAFAGLDTTAMSAVLSDEASGSAAHELSHRADFSRLGRLIMNVAGSYRVYAAERGLSMRQLRGVMAARVAPAIGGGAAAVRNVMTQDTRWLYVAAAGIVGTLAGVVASNTYLGKKRAAIMQQPNIGYELYASNAEERRAEAHRHAYLDALEPGDPRLIQVALRPDAVDTCRATLLEAAVDVSVHRGPETDTPD